MLNCRNWALIEGTGGDPFFGHAGGGGGWPGGEQQDGAEPPGAGASGGVMSTAEAIDRDEDAAHGGGGHDGGGRPAQPPRSWLGRGAPGTLAADGRRGSGPLPDGPPAWRAGPGRAADGREGPANGGAAGPKGAAGGGEPAAEQPQSGRADGRVGGRRDEVVRGGLVPGSLVVTYRIQDTHKPPSHGAVESYRCVYARARMPRRPDPRTDCTSTCAQHPCTMARMWDG